MTNAHNVHAERVFTLRPTTQGQGTLTAMNFRQHHANTGGRENNLVAREMCEIATWTFSRLHRAGGMPGNGQPMATLKGSNTCLM